MPIVSIESKEIGLLLQEHESHIALNNAEDIALQTVPKKIYMALP